MGEPWLLINLVVTSFSWMVTKTVLGVEPLVCSLKEAPLKVTPEPMADECPTCKENIILTKGQLISESLFYVLNFPKNYEKFDKFLP